MSFALTLGVSFALSIPATVDNNVYCEDWAAAGACDRIRDYMLEVCPKSCAEFTQPGPQADGDRAEGAATPTVAPTPAQNLLDPGRVDAEHRATEVATRLERCEADKERCEAMLSTLEVQAKKRDVDSKPFGSPERCLEDYSRCEKDRAWLQEQAHSREQRQHERAESAIKREREAVEKLKRCQRESKEARRADAERAQEKMQEALDEQEHRLKDDHKKVMAAAAKESQRREFQFFEKAREARGQMESAKERLIYVASGQKCEDAARRADALAQELSAAERARDETEQQARGFRDREHELLQKLKSAEDALADARSELTRMSRNEEQLAARVDKLLSRFEAAGLVEEEDESFPHRCDTNEVVAEDADGAGESYCVQAANATAESSSDPVATRTSYVARILGRIARKFDGLS